MPRDESVNVPWQFVVIGFWVLRAIAPVVLVIAYYTDENLRPGPRWFAVWIGVPYLVAGVAAMPWLIRSGIRRMRDINPVDWDGKRVPVRVSREKRMVMGAVMCVGGIIASMLSFHAAAGGGTYTLFFGLIIGGVVTMITAGSADG